MEDIGVSDRNLIMHPNRTLSLDDAVGLFKQCESAMISMAGKLPRDKEQHIRRLGEFGIGYKEVPAKEK